MFVLSCNTDKKKVNNNYGKDDDGYDDNKDNNNANHNDNNDYIKRERKNKHLISHYTNI